MLKAAYLTIDDSPSADFAAKVRFLHERGIPAVFFCRGDLLERNRGAAVQALQLGFTLANHSYSHPHFSAISPGEGERQIRQADAIIQALYEEAGVAWRAKYFRFPYGDKGDGKWGYLFRTAPTAGNPAAGSRPARWLRQLSEQLPLFRARQPLAAAALGAQRKAHLQACLRSCGYELPRFEAVRYRYFQNYSQEADWIWTYDALEWATRQRRPLYGLRDLPRLLARTRQRNPPDPRGPVPDPEYGLTFEGSDEIILLHDHAETSALFYALVEELLQAGVTFKAV